MARPHSSTILTLSLAAVVSAHAARSLRTRATPASVTATNTSPPSTPNCAPAQRATPPPATLAPVPSPTPAEPANDEEEEESDGRLESIDDGALHDEFTSSEIATISAVVANANRDRESALRALSRKPFVIAHLWAAVFALDVGDAHAYAVALERISPEILAFEDASVPQKQARLFEAIRVWLDRHLAELSPATAARLAPCWAFEHYGSSALGAFGLAWGSARDRDAARIRWRCFNQVVLRSIPTLRRASLVSSGALIDAVHNVAEPARDNGSIWIAWSLDVQRIFDEALWLPEQVVARGSHDELEAALNRASNAKGNPDVPRDVRDRMRAFYAAQDEHLPVFSRAICARARRRRVPLVEWQCDERARAASNAALTTWLLDIVGS